MRYGSSMGYHSLNSTSQDAGGPACLGRADRRRVRGRKAARAGEL